MKKAYGLDLGPSTTKYYDAYSNYNNAEGYRLYGNETPIHENKENED